MADANNSTHASRANRLAVAIGLIAATLLAFELIATRLFSVILWNHFAFLAISIALFGLGVGGMTLYLMPQTFRRDRAWSQVRGAALLLPAAICVVGKAVTVKSSACVPPTTTSGVPSRLNAADPTFAIVKVRKTVPLETSELPKSV